MWNSMIIMIQERLNKPAEKEKGKKKKISTWIDP